MCTSPSSQYADCRALLTIDSFLRRKNTEKLKRFHSFKCPSMLTRVWTLHFFPCCKLGVFRLDAGYSIPSLKNVSLFLRKIILKIFLIDTPASQLQKPCKIEHKDITNSIFVPMRLSRSEIRHKRH